MIEMNFDIIKFTAQERKRRFGTSNQQRLRENTT